MATANLALKNDYAVSNFIAESWLNAVADALDKTHRSAYLAKSMAGSGDTTLALAEYDGLNLAFTGLLTGARGAVLPLTAGRAWLVYNACTGAYDLTVKGSSGTGVVVPPAARLWVVSDGTNFYAAGLPAGTVADANTVGAPSYIHRVDVAAGATGNVDTVLAHKSRVIDAWLVKRTGAGGGAGTIQIFNGASAITDAMSINVADQVIVRATTLDDAAYEIAAAGTLRITRTRTASTNEAATVYAHCLWVA